MNKSYCCDDCEEVVPTDSPSGSLMQLTYCTNIICSCHVSTPVRNAKSDPFVTDEKELAFVIALVIIWFIACFIIAQGIMYSYGLWALQ